VLDEPLVKSVREDRVGASPDLEIDDEVPKLGIVGFDLEDWNILRIFFDIPPHFNRKKDQTDYFGSGSF
jgi:hypothetical protein